jgi:hypothetical protein
MSKIFEALSEQHHEAPVSTLPAVSPSADDGWADAAAESASNLIRGTLLKFADWRWTKGAEKTEVSIGTQFVAIVPSRRGFAGRMESRTRTKALSGNPASRFLTGAILVTLIRAFGKRDLTG